MYCQYRIVRTQDGYVLSRGEIIWRSVAKNLDRLKNEVPEIKVD